jgi:hypothetical protein
VVKLRYVGRVGEIKSLEERQVRKTTLRHLVLDSPNHILEDARTIIGCSNHFDSSAQL